MQHPDVPHSRVLLSPKEVHLLTGISVAQLELWRLKGNGGPRFSKIGRLVKYARTDVRAWLAEHGINVLLDVEAA
jgi:predicted DNA-binding transcriptional regulator AlpA